MAVLQELARLFSTVISDAGASVGESEGGADRVRVSFSDITLGGHSGEGYIQMDEGVLTVRFGWRR